MMSIDSEKMLCCYCRLVAENLLVSKDWAPFGSRIMSLTDERPKEGISGYGQVCFSR